MVGMDVDSGQYVGATRKLKDLDEVQALYTSSGDHMLMAEVRASDGDELGDVISEKLLGGRTASPRRTLLPPGTVEVTTVRRAIS